MNVTDLNYLLENIEHLERNEYDFVNVGSNSNYINYLRRSEFNYKIDELNKSEKVISILTRSGKLIDSFKYPLYPNNLEIGLKLTGDKFETEKHLTKFGFETTSSKVYSYEDMELAKNDFFNRNNSERVVIKPLNSSFGRGVFVNVSKERFEENWKLSKDDLTVTELRKENELKFIVQNFLEGFEVRATILQGTLVAMVVRVPPYVTGDGVNDLRSLIDTKNKLRSSCRYLKKYPIKITSKIQEYLYSIDLDLDYVPKENENVLLSSVSNIAAGGELINITDLVSENVKDFALDVLASIPGLYSGGLDLMLRNFQDSDPHVIEINVFPVIALTKYPTFGEPSNPPKILVESLISQYQVNNLDNESYYIKDSQMYLDNFIKFSKKKLNYTNKYFLSN